MNHTKFFERYGDHGNVAQDTDGVPVAFITIEDQFNVIQERLMDEMYDKLLETMCGAIAYSNASAHLYDAIKRRLIAEGVRFYPKLQILHQHNQRVLFEAHAMNQVELVRKAIDAQALLRHATVAYLDLTTVDLRGVDISTWDITGTLLLHADTSV